MIKPLDPLQNYKDRRENIRTGDAILFESKDLVSRAISFFTGSPITHAGMAKWIRVGGHRRLFIIEAIVTGVSLNYMSNRTAWWMPHGELWWHKIKPEHAHLGEAAAAMLMERVGTFYDFKSLLWQAVKRVNIDDSRLFCSEAVMLPWHKMLEWPEPFVAPYPNEVVSQEYGIYEKKGERIT